MKLGIAIPTYNSSKNFQVVLFSRKVKNGLGRAYLEGFDKLIKMDVEYILQMDADLSHNPVYIPAFIKVSKEHDFVVGSRYIPGGETPDWTISRRIMSKLGNIYASSLLGGQITDYTGGFNMYSVKLLHKIELNKIESTGYGFLIEIKYKALINAKSVYQVPIVFNDRQHGKSKIPKDTIVKNLVLVPRLKHNTKKPH